MVQQEIPHIRFRSILVTFQEPVEHELPFVPYQHQKGKMRL